MAKVFLENLYAKCGVETRPRFFSEKIKDEHLSRSTVYTVCFYCMSNLRDMEIY